IAAFSTVIIILVIVILPSTLIGISLVQEAIGFYDKVQSGEIDLALLFRQVFDLLPAWVTDLLNRFGLVSIGALQEQLLGGLLYGSEYIATQAISIGQSAFKFLINLILM